VTVSAAEGQLTAGLHGALDVVRSVRDGASDQHPRVVASNSDLLIVDGWVLIGGAPVAEVELHVDGAPLLRLVSGYAREDVRSVHGEVALRSGFRGALPLCGLALGSHELTLHVGAERVACFRTTPLLVADVRAPAETSDELAVAGGVQDGASYPIGTMLRVAVRAPAAPDGEALDAGAIVDDRWFVQGRPDGERFEVLLPTEQFGLGEHTVRAAAFAGERRIEGAAAALRFVVDDGS
jgi:hypothetical protein